MKIGLVLGLFVIFGRPAGAQETGPPEIKRYDAQHPPRFEEFPATETWNPPSKPLKLASPSERLFKTRLTEASKEKPNFAGHYRLTDWGCGSNCSASALIDLNTGEVFPPPLARPHKTGWDRWISCVSSFEGTGTEIRLDSRLTIIRCGMNYSEELQKNLPDTYYFVWESNRFRQLLKIPGLPPPAKRRGEGRQRD